MYTQRQLPYAPTTYIPRPALAATINFDEVSSCRLDSGVQLLLLITRPLGSQAIYDSRRKGSV